MSFFDDLFETHGDEECKSTLVILIKMMLADGEIDPKERAFLRHVCKRMKIPPRELKEAIENPEGIAFRPPAKEKDRIILLLDLIMMMLADGRIDPAEMHLAMKAAEAIGFKPIIVPALVKKIVDDAQKAMHAKQSAPQVKKAVLIDVETFLAGD